MYELPFGPGKKYLNHGVASKIAGGWQVSGIHRYQSGSPAVINSYVSPTNPYYGGNWRLSLAPGKSVFPTNPVQWSPSLDATWNSGCVQNNGVFTPNVATAPRSANCDGFVNPSAASIASGAGYAFGNLPIAVSWWRSPGYKNEDFAILKERYAGRGHSAQSRYSNALNCRFWRHDGWPEDQYFGVAGALVINNPRHTLMLIAEF
jgi:hypothetical protein